MFMGVWFVGGRRKGSGEQNFTADVVIVLQWKDPHLAHTGGGVAVYPRDQIWNPRVVVVNETNSISHRFPDSIEVTTDGTGIYRPGLGAPFTQPLGLKSLPFANQS